MKYFDFNGDEINAGDTVLVPYPNDTDIHTYSFEGYVSGFRNDNVIVDDGEGDSFEIEPIRLNNYN